MKNNEILSQVIQIENEISSLRENLESQDSEIYSRIDSMYDDILCLENEIEHSDSDLDCDDNE